MKKQPYRLRAQPVIVIPCCTKTMSRHSPQNVYHLLIMPTMTMLMSMKHLLLVQKKMKLPNFASFTVKNEIAEFEHYSTCSYLHGIPKKCSLTKYIIYHTSMCVVTDSLWYTFLLTILLYFIFNENQPTTCSSIFSKLPKKCRMHLLFTVQYTP